MENIGKVWYFDLLQLKEVPVRSLTTITSTDLEILYTTYVVMLLMVFVGWLIGKSARMLPSGPQLMAEWIVDFVDGLCKESLGARLGRSFTSFIGTLFISLLLSNYSGVFFFEEPTKDINTPLALGLLGFGIAVYQAMQFNGVWGYFRDLIMEPIPFIMFPLNLIGEISKVVSISFRIFGNILGGAVIISVVSWLVGYFILPIGLFGFFGIFVGTIQAFVFTMLTLAYISTGIEIEEEEELV